MNTIISYIYICIYVCRYEYIYKGSIELKGLMKSYLKFANENFYRIILIFYFTSLIYSLLMVYVQILYIYFFIKFEFSYATK